MYSTALEDEDMRKWTICEFDKPGDVFKWDVEKINMSSGDERMVISVKNISTDSFCGNKNGGKSEYHIFGQGSNISAIESKVLCKRMNGKLAQFCHFMPTLAHWQKSYYWSHLFYNLDVLTFHVS